MLWASAFRDRMAFRLNSSAIFGIHCFCPLCLTVMKLYFCLLPHWLLFLWDIFKAIWLLYPQKKIFRRRPVRCQPQHRKFPAGPHRCGGRPKPAYVREEVLALYAASGGSHRTIANEFNRLHAAADGTTVGASTVRIWLRKYASEMVAVQTATRNRVPYHQPRNRCWGVDMTGKAEQSSAQHVIFGIIDHGSRRILRLDRLLEKSSAAFLQQVLLTVEQYGKPACIRTDNDAVFCSPVFRDGLAKAGIRHQFSERGKPWQNGRIERLFLTFKQKLDLVVLRNGVELDHLLADFRCWYNEVRPHQHLHGHTPHEVWHGIHPYSCRPQEVRRYVGWNGLLTGLSIRYY